MRKFFILITSTLLIVGFTVDSVDTIIKSQIKLYTREQVDKLVYTITTKGYKHSYNLPYDIHRPMYKLSLYELLYANIKILGFNGAGYSNGGKYENGWKKLIINNPSLAYGVVDTYGDYMIRQINSHLEYKADKDKISFSTKLFWRAQTERFVEYQNLVNTLLLLTDKELNYYIASNQSPEMSYGFKKWLNGNGIEGNPFDYSDYPGDLLRLTTRITSNYDGWSPRIFLSEVNKFCDKVLKMINSTILK